MQWPVKINLVPLKAPFYEKAKQKIAVFLKENKIDFPQALLDEAIYLNKNLTLRWSLVYNPII